VIRFLKGKEAETASRKSVVPVTSQQWQLLRIQTPSDAGGSGYGPFWAVFELEAGTKSAMWVRVKAKWRPSDHFVPLQFQPLTACIAIPWSLYAHYHHCER
jgi:hypothetical protein